MHPLQPLQPNDKRLIAACLLAVAAGGLYVRANYSAAFPQASLELKLSKDEITSKAEAFLRGQSLATAGFHNLTLFDPDDDARVYLERELGLAQANRLMQQTVPVWRWRARWFAPPQKEEMLVYLSPSGRLTGYEHKLKEDAPAASLGADRARELASSFLKQQSQSPHRLIGDQVEKKTNREDYVFTWEQQDFKAKDATIRRTVVVQGDKIGRYLEFLHVPEQWQRDFSGLRSANELYASIAQGFFYLLVLVALVMLFVGVWRRDIPWFGLLLIAGAVALVNVLNDWNELPFFLDRSPTSSPLLKSALFGWLQSLGQGVYVLLYVLIAAAAGEPLYRKAFPHHLQLAQAFTLRGIQTRSFFMATVVGYGFTAFHLSFLTAFYLIGSRMGVWSPQDVAYSEILATPVPFLYPMAIAAMAASAEEFWFRLFAIPLLGRFVRWRWLAIVIPAFAWGFLHANYPQQPGYIRGIEVGLIGVAAGFLMTRFGIVATLVWHYTVDAGLIGSFMLQADGWLYRISGALVAGLVLLPLLASWILYKRNGGFLPEEELLNDAVADHPLTGPLTEAAPVYAPPLAPARPLRWLWIAAGLALVGGVLVHPTTFGDYVSVRLSRPEARQIADNEMRARHVDPSSWQALSDFIPNLQVSMFEYLREQAGSAQAIEAVRARTIAGVWRTRYFQPLHSEEWLVYVDQSGKVPRVDHNVDEKAPGANIPPPEAQQRVEQYLRRQLGERAAGYTLVDSQTEKLDKRTDHEFVYEDPAFHIGQAKARVSIQLVGDDVSDLRRFVKLPEEWLREFQDPKLGGYLIYVAFGSILVPLLLRLIRRLSQHEHRFHWRVYLGVTLATVLLVLLSDLNEWPLLFANYDTSSPVANFYGRVVASYVQSLLISGLGGFVAVFLLDVFLQMAAGLRALPRPSLAKSAAVAALLWGALRVLAFARDLVPGPRATLPLWDLPGADTVLPAFAVLWSGYEGALLSVCGFGALLCGALIHFRPGTFRWVLLGLAVAYGAGSALTPLQLFAGIAIGLAAVGIVGLIVMTIGPDLVTLAIAFFWLAVAGRAIVLIQQPSPWFKWNGVAAIALAFLVGCGAYYWHARYRESTSAGVCW